MTLIWIKYILILTYAVHCGFTCLQEQFKLWWGLIMFRRSLDLKEQSMHGLSVTFVTIICMSDRIKYDKHMHRYLSGLNQSDRPLFKLHCGRDTRGRSLKLAKQEVAKKCAECPSPRELWQLGTSCLNMSSEHEQ